MKGGYNQRRMPDRPGEIKNTRKEKDENILKSVTRYGKPTKQELESATILKEYNAREANLMGEIDKILDDNGGKAFETKYPRDRRPPPSKSIGKKLLPAKKAPESNVASQALFKKTNSFKAIDSLKPPLLSCENWICLNGDTGELIYGKNHYAEREMASLTKIMTCLVAVEFVEKYKIDLDKTHYLVSNKAGKTPGTTANLRPDDYVCVRDLLYGLMLPSGNDAAQTLAENIVTHQFILSKHKNANPNDLSYDEEVPENKDLEEEFYYLMNQKARDLGLKYTVYDSPHGLTNDNNTSCCFDQALLSMEAMKHAIIRDIVKTQVYSAIIERNDKDYELVWRNTNKLLDQRGYLGIKTGITNAAGGCLSTLYSVKGLSTLVVVLGSKNAHFRFSDTQEINSWVGRNYKEIMNLPIEERCEE